MRMMEAAGAAEAVRVDGGGTVGGGEMVEASRRASCGRIA
jgi:hypothetical protein